MFSFPGVKDCYNRAIFVVMNFPPQRRTTPISTPHSNQSVSDLLITRRKPSILVVDDDPLNAELLGELLSSRGYRLTTVQHSAEAETQIRRDPPDLILLDVVMPGKSGFELCRELKGDP